MAPVIFALKKKQSNFKICVTAQHREMLDQVLEFFDIVPDYDLNLMQAGQTLNSLSSRIFNEVDEVLEIEKPELVLVHGDTTTSTIIAQASFHRKIKVAHVEAGLRTFKKEAPYPEEINRQITARIADFHFAPTLAAVENLKNEGISHKRIFNTGNTIIDAVNWAKENNSFPKNHLRTEIEGLKLDEDKKLVLVTGHRRENFGEGLEKVCQALKKLSAREDIQIVYLVHLNPNVQEPVFKMLDHTKDIFLLPPLSYPAMLYLMDKASLLISDSGGIQEEAAAFKKPVLVTRDFTERNEGVKAGFSWIVGTDKEKIVSEANRILSNPPNFENLENPFGDGKAAFRIVEILYSHFP